jgi:predicted RNA-binding protein (virulence factor B family)
MIKLGIKQVLKVVRKVDFGVYVGEELEAKEDERILLPKKHISEDIEIGTEIEVFIYKDSSDRLIATVDEPYVTLGKVALLKVAEVGIIGAFLDWGLEKDLLLPFREQTMELKEGDDCLVALYIDKSSRLCGTMKVYHYLKTQSPYIVGDQVTGLVYEISEQFGVFVAVDNIYSGLIPRQEAQGNYRVGDVISLRVTNVREDGKLNLSARQKVQDQIQADAQLVMQRIQKLAGELPFDDKASPEKVKEEFGLSKAAFKRAVGRLLKEGMITLKSGKIYLK